MTLNISKRNVHDESNLTKCIFHTICFLFTKRFVCRLFGCRPMI